MFRGSTRGFAEARELFRAIPSRIQRETVRAALQQAAEPTAEAARGLAPRGVGRAAKKLARQREAYLNSPLVRQRLAEGIPLERLLSVTKSRAGGGDTKHLADSIRVFDTAEGQGGEGDTVSVAVSYPRAFFYGHFLEWGTVKMAARPFLRPAWDETKGKYLPTFGEHLWNAVRRALPSGWAAR